MKLELQDKIAELESRIAALEKHISEYHGVTFGRWDAQTQEHWNGIWKNIDAFFERVFK